MINVDFTKKFFPFSSFLFLPPPPPPTHTDHSHSRIMTLSVLQRHPVLCIFYDHESLCQKQFLTSFSTKCSMAVSCHVKSDDSSWFSPGTPKIGYLWRLHLVMSANYALCLSCIRIIEGSSTLDVYVIIVIIYYAHIKATVNNYIQSRVKVWLSVPCTRHFRMEENCRKCSWMIRKNKKTTTTT